MDGDGLIAGRQVDGGQRARHRGDRLHRRTHPQRLPVGHPAFQPPGPVGGADDAVGPGVHLVVGAAAAAARGLESVADLHALDRLDAHDGGGQLAVEPMVAAGERPQPHRQAQRDRLHHAAEGVAVFLGRLDLGDHVRLGGLS